MFFKRVSYLFIIFPLRLVLATYKFVTNECLWTLRKCLYLIFDMPHNFWAFHIYPELIDLYGVLTVLNKEQLCQYISNVEMTVHGVLKNSSELGYIEIANESTETQRYTTFRVSPRAPIPSVAERLIEYYNEIIAIRQSVNSSKVLSVRKLYLKKKKVDFYLNCLNDMLESFPRFRSS